MADYGKRADGTEKGSGYFGVLKRPDGGVSTELSMGIMIDNKETEVPLLVPTLTKKEVNLLLALDPKDKTFFQKIPESIIKKAVDFANYRISQNKSPFASEDERYPLGE